LRCGEELRQHSICRLGIAQGQLDLRELEQRFPMRSGTRRSESNSTGRQALRGPEIATTGSTLRRRQEPLGGPGSERAGGVVHGPELAPVLVGLLEVVADD